MSYPRDPSAGWGGEPARAMHTARTEAMTRPLPGPYAGDPAASPGRHGGGYREQAGYEPEYAYDDEYDGPYYPPLQWYQKPKVLIGLLVLVLVAGSGFYAAYALTQDAIGSSATTDQRAQLPQDPQTAPLPPDASAEAPPTQEPSPEPSASPSVEQDVAPFQDDDLRDFAGRVGRNDSDCRGTASSLENITEIVTCSLRNDATVRYLRFTSEAARDEYRATVRGGLSGQLDIRRDAVWRARGREQGTFVSGEQSGGNAYIFWDSFDEAVSGELVIPGEDTDDAEDFWRRTL